MSAAESYPLRWPEGWPRTRSRATTHPFKRRYDSPISFDSARRSLTDELRLLSARDVVLSTNVPLRNDGHPYADAARRRMDDPGVAVYFTFRGKQMVMAQDRYWDVAANLRSLGLAIEGMRQLERHGGGTMMERAFDGFARISGPEGSKTKRPWWQVLRYSNDADERAELTTDEVEARYRSLAKKRHPDIDGWSDELMSELNQAREDASRDLGPA